eukprot:gb/GFBE01037372.1/.p1 GENE.gb/GFBE01037372.1/~~gb/GFBE01037372.1/.p1  ORF type:complete len:359 (+),score=66.96 gb/GFBE01037372.1/:1-1077(+)
MSTAAAGHAQPAQRKELAARCRKTSLCKFFLANSCQRGTNCNFAHGQSELMKTPDLRGTQPCPTLIAGGRCEDKNCRFAHNAAEFRKFPDAQGSRDGTCKPEHSTKNSSTFVSPGQGLLSPEARAEGSTSVAAMAAALTAALQSLNQVLQAPEVPKGQGLVPAPVAPRSVCGAVERRELAARCKKTALCKFYQVSSCERGAHCNFAHGPHELQPAPDLSLTQLCPNLAAGQCQDEGCKFAHSAAELRKFPSSHDAEGTSTLTTACEDEDGTWSSETPFSRQSTKDSNSSSVRTYLATAPQLNWGPITDGTNIQLGQGRLHVKNTFLTLDSDELTDSNLKRSSSSPMLCSAWAASKIEA